MNASEALPPPTLGVDGLAVSRASGCCSRVSTCGLARAVCCCCAVRTGPANRACCWRSPASLRPDAGTIGTGPSNDASATCTSSATRPGVKTRLTLGENLRFWRERQRRQRAWRRGGAGARSGSAGSARSRRAICSAGQTRRLALARLLVAPTAGLAARRADRGARCRGRRLVGAADRRARGAAAASRSSRRITTLPLSGRVETHHAGCAA